MSAPTPWSGPLPLIFTGSYQKRQYGAGNAYVPTFSTAPGSLGGGTVFDNLVNPPATGVTAESASLAFAQAIGVADVTWVTTGGRTYATGTTAQTNGKPWYGPATVTKMITKNFDFYMNFFLENSIARSSGVPIA